MFKTVQFSLALVMVSALGCSPDIMKLKIMNETRVAISGIVIDGETSEPVNGVDVKLEENTVRTDNDGYYKVDDVMSGEYKLIVNKSGYKKLAETVNLYTKKVIDLRLYKTSSSNASTIITPYSIVNTPYSVSSTAPVAVPNAVPTFMPTSRPSPIFISTTAPTVVPTVDISAYATIRGIIVDDSNLNLDGVTVTAKSLNVIKPYSETVTTSNGSYLLSKVPTGVTIEIVAIKTGYTTRTRTVVPLVNNQGGSAINDMNFGQNSDGTQNVTTALSDKPEIKEITPNYNTSGVDPLTKFVIKFSEPMDKASVEDNFIIIENETNAPVASKDNYTFVWNSTGDEVIIAPNGAYSLPKGKALAVSFKSTSTIGIKDSGGKLGRLIDLNANDGCFRVTSVFKGKSPFTVAN